MGRAGRPGHDQMPDRWRWPGGMQGRWGAGELGQLPPRWRRPGEMEMHSYRVGGGSNG